MIVAVSDGAAILMPVAANICSVYKVCLLYSIEFTLGLSEKGSSTYEEVGYVRIWRR